MTQKELLALPHLAVAEVNEKWVHIHTEEGYYITDFDQETGDINEYSDFTCMYSPINKEEYPEYYIITEVEHLTNEENKRNQEF